MYVKTFEGDTLDETIKSVKSELGPDAIILKTITNKGLKGAFKKKRIEITAAISETSYLKKAKIDSVLPDDERKKFQQASAGQMAKAINQYHKTTKPEVGNSQTEINNSKNFLNPLQESTKSVVNKLRSGLDDFLGDEVEEVIPQRVVSQKTREVSNTRDVIDEIRPRERDNSGQVSLYVQEELKDQQRKIIELEDKLYSLMKDMTASRTSVNEKSGLHQLRVTLKTLDIDEKIIQSIIKKAVFELTPSDLEDMDTVFDFGLRNIAQSIKVDMPLFSSPDAAERPVVTVLLSETASGQTSMGIKLAAIKKDSMIIQYCPDEESNNTHDMALKLHQVEMVKANTLAEVVSHTRKATEKKLSVFIDYRGKNERHDETKKFIEGLRRSFPLVESLLTISAIHSEIYNRKIVQRYKELVQGCVISHLDLCLSYGPLLNIHQMAPDVALKFFGTGPTVPDDIETASVERILEGMFQF